MSRARNLHDERGFTLVELLVVIAISTIVVGIAGSAVIRSLGHQRQQVGQVHALNEAKQSFERVTRDLRGAHRLVVAEDDRARVEFLRDGELRTVTVSTAAVAGSTLRELVHTEVRRDEVTGVVQSNRSQVLLRGLVVDPDEPLFTYRLDDNSRIVAVDVTLRFQPPEGQAIVISNEVAMRNMRR